MSVYLQYILSAVHYGTCNKGDERGSQLHDKTQQMHFYSGKCYLNDEDKNGRRIKVEDLQLAFISTVHLPLIFTS